MGELGSGSLEAGDGPDIVDIEPRRHVLTSDTERVLSRLHSEVHDLLPAEPKRGPASAALWWWLSWAIPGLGMFTEAYFLFAIGNIEPLLEIIYPNCWGKEEPADCDWNVVKNVSTIEITGIVAGMLIISFFADWIGRKKGSRLCTSIMLVGAILLTAAGGSATAYLTLLCLGLWIFGFGVGGEYPLAASSAAERAEGSAENRAKRGQTIALVFTQQGWGNFSNTLVILILLACVGATGRQPTADESTVILHVQFAVGLAIILGLLVYRFTKLEESKVWEAERRGVDQELKDEGDDGKDSAKLYSVVLKRNWPRLLETSFAWFLNDFVFYGNKLFQSRFIEIMSGPDAPLFTNISWTLLNSGIGLAGYFMSAFMIDRRWYGRFWIQANGFLMLGVIFLVCAIWYDWLVSEQLQLFQFLYFFSTFWGQFGPNATTYVVPGEVFPTDVRAFFHGISAATGKLGAIAASQVFASASITTIFYVSSGCGFFGVLFTWLLLPDTTGLDLGELDRLNRYLLAGKVSKYHGEAANPLYLSIFERILGYGKAYDPVLDEEQKCLQRADILAKSSRQGSA